MSYVELDIFEKPVLNKPVLIEGLPGVGEIGKISADFLCKELNAKPFAYIYSSDFPPQVNVLKGGKLELLRNVLSYYKRDSKKESDLIFLTGASQATTPRGHYKLTDSVLDVVKPMGTERICTLGGYSVGYLIKSPKVVGAATHPELIEEFKKYGVIFSGELPGSIIGAAGLLPGRGMLREIPGICLMGETPGYFPRDPKAAKEVLKIVTSLFNLHVNYEEIDEEIRQMEPAMEQLRAMDRVAKEQRIGREKPEEPGYIG
jgi:hypothetical protein